MIATDKSPLIIGHRGASALAPENTLAAFARALRDGADGIELDVRLSRDGVPVVIHNPRVRSRIRSLLVSRLTSAQLRQIDIGSWFNRRHRDLAGVEFTRQRIPTLDDVFELLTNQKTGRFLVYVELKCGRSRKRNEALVRATIASVRRYRMEKQVILISFNLHAVASAKQFDDSIRTGALFGPKQAAVKPAKKIIQAALACSADEILLHHRMATRKLIAAARTQQLLPVVWTVEGSNWIERARMLRLHALITNNPLLQLRGSEDGRTLLRRPRGR